MGSITNPPNYGQIPPSVPAKRKWNPNIYIPAIVIALMLLWYFGRGSKKVYEAADVGVARFHGLMNQEGYELIYQEATPEFQNHGSREETLGFLRRVHTSLGNEHQCHMTGFSVNRTLNGTFAVLTYSTTFDRGTAKEQFSWRMSGNDAKLVGYRIDSEKVKP
jgi:hypothetical protein